MANINKLQMVSFVVVVIVDVVFVARPFCGSLCRVHGSYSNGRHKNDDDHQTSRAVGVLLSETVIISIIYPICCSVEE